LYRTKNYCYSCARAHARARAHTHTHTHKIHLLFIFIFEHNFEDSHLKLASDYARFVTVQNSQFSIHIRFANGHIRRICTRRLILSIC